MISSKQLKLEQKGTVQLHRAISDLQKLAQDIERCEKIISDLQTELDAVNTRHAGAGPRAMTSLLTSLLECAKKKLAWEKADRQFAKTDPGDFGGDFAIDHDPKALRPIRSAPIRSARCRLFSQRWNDCRVSVRGRAPD